MRILPLVVLPVLAGCPKSSAPGTTEPLRFALSQVPFQDLCISRVPTAKPPKAKDLEHLERAIGFLEQAKFNYALTAVAQVSDPLHPRAESLRAVTLTLSGRAAEADPIFTRLLEAYPDDGCLGMGAALTSAALGDLDTAASRADAARKADAESVDAALLWASLAGTAKPETAATHMSEVYTQFPDSPGTAWLYGIALLDSGKMDEAREPLNKAGAAGLPVDPLLVEVFFGQGDMDGYLRHLEAGAPLVNAEAVKASDTPLATLREHMGLGEGDALFATIQTSMGDYRCELYVDQAPLTVSSFYGLATGELPWLDPRTGEPGEGPLYKDIVFHRVIPEFMVQGGDPLGTGTGGPGYQYRDEPVEGLTFARGGMLAMANSGPTTNGSQFFVTEVPTPHLNYRHTIFGDCGDEGIALTEKIARVPAENSRPNEDVVLKAIAFEAVSGSSEVEAPGE